MNFRDPSAQKLFSKELNQVTKQRKILKEVLIFSQRVFLILNDFSDFSTHHQIYSPLPPLLAVEDTTSRTENNRRIFLIFLNFISDNCTIFFPTTIFPGVD